jgi:hypothetical protein
MAFHPEKIGTLAATLLNALQRNLAAIKVNHYFLISFCLNTYRDFPYVPSHADTIALFHIILKTGDAVSSA